MVCGVWQSVAQHRGLLATLSLKCQPLPWETLTQILSTCPTMSKKCFIHSSCRIISNISLHEKWAEFKFQFNFKSNYMMASPFYQFTLDIQHSVMQSHFTEPQSVSITLVQAGRGNSKGRWMADWLTSRHANIWLPDRQIPLGPDISIIRGALRWLQIDILHFHTHMLLLVTICNIYQLPTLALPLIHFSFVSFHCSLFSSHCLSMYGSVSRYE